MTVQHDGVVRNQPIPSRRATNLGCQSYKTCEMIDVDDWNFCVRDDITDKQSVGDL